MPKSSDSADSDLFNPRNGLRKASQKLSQHQGGCNESTAYSSLRSQSKNNRLSLSYKKRANNNNTTILEEDDSGSFIMGTQQSQPALPLSLNCTRPRVSDGVSSPETPRETPPKRFKPAGSSPSSSDHTPALSRTPTIVRRSQQEPDSSEPLPFPVTVQSPIRCPDGTKCQSKSRAHWNAYRHEEKSPSSSSQSVSPDHSISVVLLRAGVSEESRSTQPEQQHEPPAVPGTKMDYVRMWVESCDLEQFEPIPLGVEEEEPEEPPRVAEGADPDSPVVVLQQEPDVPDVPEGLVTPKRKAGPAAINGGSSGKQTAITAYFTPHSSAPPPDGSPVNRVQNGLIAELNAPDSPETAITLQQVTVTATTTTTAKAQWSSLMSRMRGTAQTVRQEIQQVRGRAEVSTKAPAGTDGRKCPFYRLIPGTGFAVDAFNYGRIKGVTHYFLSHFHYDHYRGLGKWLDKPLYCSQVTANLVQLKIRLDPKLIHVIPLNESRVINNVEVILIDANHCPGAVMFLFRFPNGRSILHVGDFRAHPSMESLKELNQRPIDELYLDTTYCDPNYELPSQEEALAYVGRVVRKYADRYAKLLVVCGSYTIGKEKVFMAAAEELRCKVWAPTDKRRILGCLEDPDLSGRLVSDPLSAKVHVLNMGDVKVSNLRSYLDELSPNFSHVLALNPTGWEFDHRTAGRGLDAAPAKAYGNIFIQGVPYSEHSSYTEMRRFVRHFGPRRIVPTVNVGTAKQREKMEGILRSWLGRSPF